MVARACTQAAACEHQAAGCVVSCEGGAPHFGKHRAFTGRPLDPKGYRCHEARFCCCRAQASTPEISEQEIRLSDSSKRPKNDASARHIKTEQARRDKIAAGFSALSDLLPGKEKVEKALLLTQAAEYISQLQVEPCYSLL